MTKSQALDAAMRVDTYGREIILVSSDLKQIQRVAAIVGNVGLTVTVSPYKSLFEEYIAGSVVDWLNDLAEAVVFNERGDRSKPLMDIIGHCLLQADAHGRTRFARLLTKDAVLWKSVRLSLRELFVRACSLGADMRLHLCKLMIIVFRTCVDAR